MGEPSRKLTSDPFTMRFSGQFVLCCCEMHGTPILGFGFRRFSRLLNYETRMMSPNQFGRVAVSFVLGDRIYFRILSCRVRAVVVPQGGYTLGCCVGFFVTISF